MTVSVMVTDEQGAPAQPENTRLYILAVPLDAASVDIGHVANDENGFGLPNAVVLLADAALYLANATGMSRRSCSLLLVVCHAVSCGYVEAIMFPLLGCLPCCLQSAIVRCFVHMLK